ARAYAAPGKGRRQLEAAPQHEEQRPPGAQGGEQVEAARVGEQPQHAQPEQGEADDDALDVKGRRHSDSPWTSPAPGGPAVRGGVGSSRTGRPPRPRSAPLASTGRGKRGAANPGCSTAEGGRG